MASLTSPLILGRWIALAAAIVAPVAGVRATPLEQAIKASYVTKFAPFVEWPPSAFAGAGSPLTICLSGRDPFGSVIDELARGQMVRGHLLQIRRLSEGGTIGGCHILVIGVGAPAADSGQLVDKPILTVSDRAAGAGAGMIRFVRQGGRIRFEIDNGAARAAHLSISSKLLGLAVTVIP